MRQRRFLRLALLAAICFCGASAMGAIAVGGRVKVTSSVGVNVRQTASTTGTKLGAQPYGAQGQVLSGPQYANGYTWWYVNFDTGDDGWSASDNGALTEVAVAQSDLIPQSLSVSPSSGVAGSAATVSFTIRNQGSGTASSSTANLRLSSSSSSVTTSDPLLKSVSVASLSGGGTRNYNELVTIPSGTGQKYVWLILDVNSTANQSNENNDKDKVAFNVTSPQSDLVPQSLSVSPSSGVAGSSATVSFTVRNQGSGTASSSTANLRLSPSSSSVTTSDPLLKSVSVASLSGGGTRNYNESVTIPSGTGQRYVWLILDVDSTANQSNENNDKDKVAFNVTSPQSDLVPQSLSVSPSSGVAGSSATVSFTIRNQGSGTASASTANLRLSASSSSVSTADPLLKSVSVASLSGGATRNYSESVTIPSGTGQKYVWLILDVNSTANQSNENNDKDKVAFNLTSPQSSGGLIYPFGDGSRRTQVSDGDGWYAAQDHGDYYAGNGKYHIGEDWNAESGGNTDLGESVLAIGDGTIIKAGAATASNWGNVVIIRHQRADGSYFESLYGHLDTVGVSVGATVTKGATIGTIGTGGGLYSAHLHFEIRLPNCPSWGTEGSGYATTATPAGWVDPSDFIDTYSDDAGGGGGSVPTITSVSPNPVSASGSNQSLVITGTGFQSGATLEFDPPTGDNIDSNAEKLDVEPGSRITYQFNNGNDVGTWTVKVINPNGGGESDPFSFQVATVSAGSVTYGIDVSHYQNEAGAINWGDVYNAEKRFVFVKASEANDLPDEYLTANMEGATNAGLLTAPYHFARPDFPAVPNDLTASAVAEADYFLSVAGSYVTTGYLPPVLDIESQAIDDLTKAQVSSWMRAWLTRVTEQTGVTPIIYVTRSLLVNFIEDDIETSYPLWIATDDGNVSDTPSYQGISWPSWKFKQYRFGEHGGTCPGVTGDCDLNSFNGDLSMLQAMVISGTGVVSTPTINTFDDTELTLGDGDSVSIGFSVSPSGASPLDYVELWRVADDNGQPGDWGEDPYNQMNADASVPFVDAFSDSPSIGTWWYGIHAVDQAGHRTTEEEAGFSPKKVIVLPVYTVTFDPGEHGSRSGGGALTQSVREGEDAVEPTITEEAGWRFDSWDASFTNVTANLTLTAQFTFVGGVGGGDPVADPDLDGSGTVDQADAALVLEYMGGDDSRGDANGDGVVDVRDLVLIQQLMGSGGSR